MIISLESMAQSATMATDYYLVFGEHCMQGACCFSARTSIFSHYLRKLLGKRLQKKRYVADILYLCLNYF